MKKSLIALAALAAVSAVSAQSSVSIYGNLDQTYYRASEGGLTQSGLSSSAGTTSTLGFKGSEDLGNGLSANFNLLSELSMKEGQMGSTTSGNAAASGQKPNIFTRGATIGLASKTYGSFDMGRVTDSAWVTQGTFNNTGINSFGYNALTATASNIGAVPSFTGKTIATETTFSGTTAGLATNGVANQASIGSAPFNFGAGFSYNTPEIAGFKGSIQKFGTQDSDVMVLTGQGMAYSLTYSNPMGIRVAAAFNDRNGNNGKTAISQSIYGAEYKTGQLSFVVGMTKTKHEGTLAAQDSLTTTGLGVGYALSPVVDLNAAYTMLKNDTTAGYKTTITAVTARYKFSARTSIYGGLGFGQNDGALNKQSIYYAGAAPATGGTNQSGFLVGIKHAF